MKRTQACPWSFCYIYYIFMYAREKIFDRLSLGVIPSLPFFFSSSVPLFVVLTCLIAVPDCLRVVVSSPSFLPESPSFPSLRFFLPLLPFFSFFSPFFCLSLLSIPLFFSFFFIFLKKVAETFCGYLKSSYLCTRFPQGGLD